MRCRWLWQETLVWDLVHKRPGESGGSLHNRLPTFVHLKCLAPKLCRCLRTVSFPKAKYCQVARSLCHHPQSFPQYDARRYRTCGRIHELSHFSGTHDVLTSRARQAVQVYLLRSTVQLPLAICSAALPNSSARATYAVKNEEPRTPSPPFDYLENSAQPSRRHDARPLEDV